MPHFPPLPPIPYVPSTGTRRSSEAKAAASSSGMQVESGTFWKDSDEKQDAIPMDVVDVVDEDSHAGGDTDDCTERNMDNVNDMDNVNNNGSDNGNDIDVKFDGYGDIDDDNTHCTSNSNVLDSGDDTAQPHSVPPPVGTPSFGGQGQGPNPRDGASPERSHRAAKRDTDTAEQGSSKQSSRSASPSTATALVAEVHQAEDNERVPHSVSGSGSGSGGGGASGKGSASKPLRASQHSIGSLPAVSYLAVPPSPVAFFIAPPSAMPVEKVVKRNSNDVVDLTEEDDICDVEVSTDSRLVKEKVKEKEKGNEKVKEKGEVKRKGKGMKESPVAVAVSERLSDEGTENGDIEDTEDSREGESECDDPKADVSIEMGKDNDVDKSVEEEDVKKGSKKSTGIAIDDDAGEDADVEVTSVPRSRADSTSGQPTAQERRSVRLNPANDDKKKKKGSGGGRLKRKQRTSNSGSDSDFEHSESEGPTKKASRGKNGSKVKRSDEEEEDELEDSESGADDDDDDDFELPDSDVELIPNAKPKSSELEDSINAEWNKLNSPEETNSFFRPRPSSSSSSSSSAHPKKFILSDETKLQQMENRRLQKDKKAFKFFEQNNGKRSAVLSTLWEDYAA